MTRDEYELELVRPEIENYVMQHMDDLGSSVDKVVGNLSAVVLPLHAPRVPAGSLILGLPIEYADVDKPEFR